MGNGRGRRGGNQRRETGQNPATKRRHFHTPPRGLMSSDVRGTETLRRGTFPSFTAMLLPDGFALFISPLVDEREARGSGATTWCDFSEIGLFQRRFRRRAGQCLSLRGDSAESHAAGEAYAGGDPVVVGELARFAVAGDRFEDAAAGAGNERVRHAIPYQPAPGEEEQPCGRGLDVAGDVRGEDDDAVAGECGDELAEVGARFDIEAGGRLVDDQ